MSKQTKRPEHTVGQIIVIRALVAAMVLSAVQGCEPNTQETVVGTEATTTTHPETNRGPCICVTIPWPETNLYVVEQLVTAVVERHILSLGGLQEARSASSEGKCVIHLFFAPGADAASVLAAVRTGVRASLPDLPVDSGEPTFEMLGESANSESTGSESDIRITLEGESGLESGKWREFLELTKSRLKNVKSVRSIRSVLEPPRLTLDLVLTDDADRHSALQTIRECLDAGMPGFLLAVEPVPPVQVARIDVLLDSPDVDSLSVAHVLFARLLDAPGVGRVDAPALWRKPVLSFVVDVEKLAKSGANGGQIADLVKAALGKNEATGNPQSGGSQERSTEKGLADLSRMPISTAGGNVVRFSDIGSWEYSIQPRLISRVNGLRCVTLDVYADGLADPSAVLAKIRSVVAKTAGASCGRKINISPGAGLSAEPYQKQTER